MSTAAVLTLAVDGEPERQLARSEARYRGLLEAAPLEAAVSDESLAQRAHKIVSQAGMLGLTRMSQCARVLEEACRAGDGQAAAQGECRAATGDIEQYAMPAAALPPEAKTANG